MSVDDVKKYVELLATDEEFAQAIIATGADKTAKMNVIRQKGLDFTKDEFRQAAKGYQQTAGGSDCDSKCKLDDEQLDDVAAAGRFGQLFGAITGGVFGGILGIGIGIANGVTQIAEGKNIAEAAESGLGSAKHALVEGSNGGGRLFDSFIPF